ncbi:OmpW/AlkL family protein [Halomonas sp. M20]|uniref:OmpW/AlkL family protein n=1 Tax=Halomonas sp. M20 TaxID=2763264 RepID=UPI001D0A96EE|nr:OmpW family outer membrane protein [Halomonas sp. M20]
MRVTPLLTGAIFLASMTAASSVMAYGQNDFYTRFGVAKVSPKSDNGDLSALGINEIDVGDDSAFAFTLGYRFLDQLGVELLAAERFEHEIELDGANVASTKHLPPTLTLQYYPFGGTDSRVQPYVGAGVNYTRFSDETLDLPGADLELDNSWGYAAQFGVDLLISEHWALNAAAWYLDIDSDATVSAGGADYDTEVEIDPLVVMGGLSFRF